MHDALSNRGTRDENQDFCWGCLVAGECFDSSSSSSSSGSEANPTRPTQLKLFHRGGNSSYATLFGNHETLTDLTGLQIFVDLLPKWKKLIAAEQAPESTNNDIYIYIYIWYVKCESEATTLQDVLGPLAESSLQDEERIGWADSQWMVRVEADFDEVLNVNRLMPRFWNGIHFKTAVKELTYVAPLTQKVASPWVFWSCYSSSPWPVPRTGHSLNPPFGCGWNILIGISER